MHKVKRCFGKRLAQNVVAPHFQVRRVYGLKKTWLKIGRDDVTAAPYLAAEPFCDGAASRSYFQAAPAFSHSYLPESPDRPGVQPSFK
jgi:hypothetical protein